MFKFIIKRGVYNLVLKSYISHLHVYKNEILKISSSISDDITDAEIFKLNYEACQKYYSDVFNHVCHEIGNNIPNFKSLLPLKIAAYNLDLDNLVAANVYDFVFWCITNKKANPKKCIEINHYVHDLKNQCLLEIDKSITQ